MIFSSWWCAILTFQLLPFRNFSTFSWSNNANSCLRTMTCLPVILLRTSAVQRNHSTNNCHNYRRHIESNNVFRRINIRPIHVCGMSGWPLVTPISATSMHRTPDVASCATCAKLDANQLYKWGTKVVTPFICERWVWDPEQTPSKSSYAALSLNESYKFGRLLGWADTGLVSNCPSLWENGLY